MSLTIYDSDSAIFPRGNTSVAANFAFFSHRWVHKKQIQVWMREENCRFWFFRQGQKALRIGLCTAHLQKQSHLLVQPVPSPFSHTPPTLHIVLSPVSLSVINYERHKPPGLMLRSGRLPNCTFLESQKAAFIDNARHTVRLPHLLAGRKAQDGPFTGPENTSTFWSLLLYNHRRVFHLCWPPCEI